MVNRKYTEDEHTFLREYIPGHTVREITAEFNRRFENPITEGRIKGYMARKKIKNGFTGRFEKGHPSHNKGKHPPSVGRMAETQYKKGHLPHNTKPIGYERITAEGYIEVKVRMRKSKPRSNDNFEFKHRIVWRQTHGEIPEGHCLVFLDGNKQNCELENLALVTREELSKLNKSKLRGNDPEVTKTCIAIARAGVAIDKAKRRLKNA